jgi:MazG family protein
MTTFEKRHERRPGGPGADAEAGPEAAVRPEAARGPEALARLDALTRRLRRECPWDREQDERSIVPHTVEEAYELADAASSGDDAKLLDELGDVLFQVHFLSLLMEERGAGDLAAVAEHCADKLVRRHPHVFGETEAADAAAVLRNWDAIKRTEDGAGEGALPDNLPATIYARKVQRRAAAAGETQPELEASLDRVTEQAGRLRSAAGGRAAEAETLGELLYAAVGAARALGTDAELALREAANRRRRAGPEAP